MASQATEHLRDLLARNIDASITASGKTNREVGAAMDASEAQVSKWRRGTHSIGQRNLAALALALEHDIAWFYTDHDAEPTGAAA